MLPPHNPPTASLLNLDPLPRLRQRLGAELAADFSSQRPTRFSRAPGRLDVMGGILDYTGGLVCEMTLERAAAMAMQEREDRELQIFSFNLLDEHEPFTFRIPLDALASATAEALRRDLAEPARRWAGYIAGCLFILHEQKLINLHRPEIRGLNIALLSTVPMGAGISSSAAIEVATMMNLIDHFSLRNSAPSVPHSALSTHHSPLYFASLCQQVENRVVGAPCGIMDQVTSFAGETGSLLRLLCQPHEVQPPLRIPEGVRFVGINSGVKHSVGGGIYGRTRAASFMGHRIILEQMRQMGLERGLTLIADPMNGYLANLDLDDYRRFFRAALPQSMKGLDFLEKYGPTIDKATVVHPDGVYHVQQATDHHVFEMRRMKNFVAFMESAASMPVGSAERGLTLDKAGHLMYASHISCTKDALLGADECDLLVELARQRERTGLYGAKITGGRSGGTVAFLANEGESADAAIAEIMAEYEKRTGRRPEAIIGSSPGAWALGTVVV